MNKIFNNFFLTGDKFVPELHLKQPRFTYSVCGPFTKHRERTQKFREASNLKHLYRNKLVKACFAHDAAYFEIKDKDKILKIRAYKIAINHKYDGHQRVLAKMVY